MIVNTIWRRVQLVALAALAVLAACSGDAVTNPARVAPTSPNSSLLGSLTTLTPLQRKIPLSHDISVSATIGAQGGTIEHPQGGLTLTIPAGAVSRSTLFTVTAVEGSAVAYEFAPHGVTFAKPLQASQDLSHARGVLTLAPLLKAGYFRDRSLISEGGLRVLVSEVLPGLLDLRLTTFRWRIPHFSGYIVAW